MLTVSRNMTIFSPWIAGNGEYRLVDEVEVMTLWRPQ